MSDKQPGGIWGLFATMPSTNIRIACTILLMLATGARVVASKWDPGWEWLAFLLASAGLDIAQFSAKRATSTEYVAAQQGTPPATPPAAPPQPEIGT